MKSSTVWHGHSTRRFLLAGTARKVSGHLSGRGPSILLRKTALPLKSPTGAFIAALRKRELAYGRRNRLIMQTTKNRKFPLGNSLLYRLLLSVVFGRVRPQGAPCFFTTLHRFLRAASGIRHQHESGSDAAHPGIVPIFCAGTPYKHARRQCHFLAYCPILSA